MMEDFYREYILDHYRNPRNRGVIESPDITYVDSNPLCGDEIRIDVRITDGVISEIAFDGRGCAVSQASASILTEMVEGKTLDEVKAIGRDELLNEIGIPVSPARMKCAMLGLKVLKAGVYGIDHATQSLDEG